MIISIIAAMSQNKIIGNQGAMPWKSKEEMEYFKQKTIGHPIIMGRKTWDSLRNRPLKDRFNIVITRDKELRGMASEQKEGPVFVSSLKDAIDAIDDTQVYETFIIGGSQIYEAALQQDLIDRMYINVMNFSCVGDTTFPYFEINQWDKQQNQGQWKEFISYTLTKKVDK
jgi:dihydrofolate reductase